MSEASTSGAAVNADAAATSINADATTPAAAATSAETIDQLQTRINCAKRPNEQCDYDYGAQAKFGRPCCARHRCFGQNRSLATIWI